MISIISFKCTFIVKQKENNKQCDIEHAVTRVMELEYCKSVYENAR
jgi:hypothetical protein